MPRGLSLAVLTLVLPSSASYSEPSARSHTVILMSDTHKPLPLPSRANELHFTALAAVVNAHYACVHGYDFLFVRLSESQCVHPIFGARHPSYCKLPAVAAALRRWQTVVFVDSDSWLVPHIAPPIETLLAQHDLSQRTSRRTGASEEPPSLYLGWDYPYSNGPNCGLMLWRNSTRAMRMLATWWHLDPGPYALEHDFEQRLMHWAVVHLERFRGAVTTLRVAPLGPYAATDGSAVVHVDHTRKATRYWRLSLALLAIVTPPPPSLSAPTRTMTNVSPMPAAADVTNDTVSAQVRMTAVLLADESRRRVYATSHLRRTLLRAGLMVARQLLRTVKCSQPPKLGKRAHAPRKLSACMRVRAFNATRAGIGFLPPHLAMDPPQPHAPRTVQAPSAVHMTESAEALPAAAALGLDGIPLVMRPCRESLREWQTWQHDDISAGANRSGAYLRLAAFPNELCVAVGPGRATREPHLPLAQLHRCPPTTATRGGSTHPTPPRDQNSTSTHLPLELRYMAPAHAWHTLTFAALRPELEALLGTPALWPDHPHAGRRPNPDVFWPGRTSPTERAAMTADGDAEEEVQWMDEEEDGFSADEDDADSDDGQGAASEEGQAEQEGESMGYADELISMLSAAEPSTEPGSADGSAITNDGVQRPAAPPGRRLQEAIMAVSTPTSQAVSTRGPPSSGGARGNLSAPGAFAGWARSGNRTGAAVTAFILKQRRWRAINADPVRLWKPCTSEYSVGDKPKADCETWCRPSFKPAHCRCAFQQVTNPLASARMHIADRCHDL